MYTGVIDDLMSFTLEKIPSFFLSDYAPRYKFIMLHILNIVLLHSRITNMQYLLLYVLDACSLESRLCPLSPREDTILTIIMDNV